MMTEVTEEFVGGSWISAEQIPYNNDVHSGDLGRAEVRVVCGNALQNQ